MLKIQAPQNQHYRMPQILPNKNWTHSKTGNMMNDLTCRHDQCPELLSTLFNSAHLIVKSVISSQRQIQNTEFK